MKKSILTRLLLRASKVITIPDLWFVNSKRKKIVSDKKQIRFLFPQFLQTLILVLIFSSGYGQEGKKFKARYTNQSIKGNLVLIGNTMLGVTRTDAVMVPGSPIPTNLAVLTAQANSNAVYTNQANGSPWKIDPDLDGEDKEDGLANNRKSMEYIDIDNDNSTFASSSAELHIESACKKIIYAGLYWQAVYINDRSRKFNPHNENNFSGTKRLDDWDKVKFKRPWDTVIRT
ncbi:hypothetical protein [Flavobacterium sp. N502536]|uniref:hypothetical protein n=1 Tax=Flavobacterium sp. N502536 TaxID=2986837 RepID=UPI0022217D1B|nr:hypothetical protein [Flavobacterium sp. N502536]